MLQSTMRKTLHRFTRSNLELRRPKIGLEIGPRSSRGVYSAQFLAQSSTLQTKVGIKGVRKREIAK
eukprot:15467493-Alexandrium_andersonii.AAC.1